MGDDGQPLEKFESYLRILADASLDPVHRIKIDTLDLVQETLLEAHKDWDRFRGRTNAERAAWLKQMLRRNLLDAMRALRREKRDMRRERSLEERLEDSFERSSGWLVAHQSSPSQRANRNEQLLRVADALDQLPDAQRNAIVLHHLNGRSLSDVAQQLDRSISAAAALIYRGLKKMRDLLGED